jgi:nucleotide-binding universal stress UspA family protein
MPFATTKDSEMTSTSKGHVLLAHDLSERARDVTVAALDLAQALDLDLAVVHVVSEKMLEQLRAEAPEDAAYADVVIDGLRSQLRALIAEQLPSRDIGNLEFVVLRGEPDEALINYVAKNHPDIIVLGVRNRSLVGKLVFGSTVQSILLNGRCKALTVPV